MSLSLPSEITAISLAEGYPAYQIETAFCSATVALHGAHLTHWKPAHSSQPVIFNSPESVYREGKAIRGGVPICWPWFNAHPTAPEQHPSHGVARNRFWTLESATVEAGVATIRLALPVTPAIAEHVPFPYHLTAIFTLGKTCRLSLETTNLSSQNIPVGGALHTYLAVSDVEKIYLTGLQNTPYLDTTVSPTREEIQSQEQLRVEGEVDRIYSGTGNEVELIDEKWQRRIVVGKEGSLSTVVWNPWLAKATALADLPNEAYRDFVCIEATNARQDTRITPPGKTHNLVTTLQVNSL